METDTYYEMGTSHRVCEDYALSGQKDGLAYVILSDGCSSSDNSDVGARLLCHIAKGVILYLDSRNISKIDEYTPLFRELVLRKCIEVKQSLGISAKAFDATLLVAVTKNGKCLNIGWGDGYFIRVLETGIIMVKEINYASGAPYYLSYEMSPLNKEAYLRDFGKSFMDINSYIIDPADGLISKNFDSLAIDCSHSYAFSFDTLNTKFMALSSDGIGTYRHDPKCGIPLNERLNLQAIDIIPKLVGYKNTAGEFVVRRMQRLKSDMDKEKITHADDVSCTAIAFD